MLIRIKKPLVFALVIALQAGLATTAVTVDAASSSDQTTKYRVYHNDIAIKEFTTSASAVAYAKNFTYTHVEKIIGREWIWDNFPHYKVYENGVSSPGREFTTLTEAKQFASKVPFAQIRDLEKPGFVQSEYPAYRLYQGDKTLANWSFATLAEAKKAAKAFGNIHIIDLSTNQWVWDNITVYQENVQRASAPVYSIETEDGTSLTDKTYSFLLDAIRASLALPGSNVVNTQTGQVVQTNKPSFDVTQTGRVVGSYYSITKAIAVANSLSGASVVKDGLTWWTNIPYLSVIQGDKLLRSFHTRKGAVQFASQYANTEVTTADARIVWDNTKKLKLLGWNGTARTVSIMNQISQTQGLDYDSPSWFELASADGTLSDYSDPALMTSLAASGIKVTPLVSNQFDSKLTSAFLRNGAAKTNFINTLVSKLKTLHVAGVNVDFEMMAGSDRTLYTEFIRSLTKAAHTAGLTVSIDLPRGDLAWDAMTAYDHNALAGIVDMIMIMAYDQHWKGSSEAGSVAELSWVEEGVKQFLAYGVPRSKLMLGVPFYVREWSIDTSGNLVGNRALLMGDLPSLIQETGAVGTYDPISGQRKYKYTGADGYTHVFWAETADSVKARLAIAKKYDLAGVAAWRLGYEQASLWTMLLQQK
ncbi:glycosyl hydrolase family 18 protein [Paenibacillus sp. OV219]|uniref:glycosyl hydrolase family 18 protein n=1 Tax=Paenibacillus sp. OV219 TaxID=1884377 RepID=UPI0008C4957D|nr:glycosyl hydrolase family 18 protein [Paenibacillus sp. OV219]SEM80374.1 Glycosyl hydrolases family 18 [Paenibacillus sp. OV219]